MFTRRQVLTSAGAALAASQFPWGQVRAADAPRRRVLFFTKSSSFEHSATRRADGQPAYNERVLTEIGAKQGFDVTATKDGRVFDGDINQYDAFVFYTTGDLTQSGTDKQPPMSAAGKQKLIDAVAAGKGFIASHCGSDTFHSAGERFEEQSQLDPYIAMLGGEFIKHGPQQKARLAVTDAKFPGLSGAGSSFELMEEWYSLKNFADNLHVILVQDTQGMKGSDYERPNYPATWARMYEKGRVFYTSMGHREDVWDNATFQEVMLGALTWVCRNVDADVTPNIKEVTPGAHVMPPRPTPTPTPKK
ncbi:MAG: ThuA domain-containing protein [Planctomycetes bacterium]|nr:ThuA domain-containing protein [Planctomycetota bacterium]